MALREYFHRNEHTTSNFKKNRQPLFENKGPGAGKQRRKLLAVDNRLTVADLKVFMQMRSLANGTLDHVPADIVEQLAPALAAHRDRIAADPVVTAYYSGR